MEEREILVKICLGLDYVKKTIKLIVRILLNIPETLNNMFYDIQRHFGLYLLYWLSLFFIIYFIPRETSQAIIRKDNFLQNLIYYPDGPLKVFRLQSIVFFIGLYIKNMTL